MTLLGRAMLAWALASACTRPRADQDGVAKTPDATSTRPRTMLHASEHERVEPAPAPCKLPLEDAQFRHHGGELDDPLDLDGDGRPDTVVRSCHGGNCDFLLYRDEPPCPRYLGTISGSFMDGPTCVKPPTGGLCTLSLMRFMIHGDLQEYLFVFSNQTGEYVELGAGERYVPPPPAKLR